MATKKFTTELTLKAERDYSCNIADNYTEMFTVSQELDEGDGFSKIMESTVTKGVANMQSSKAILLKNTSNVTSEILIAVQEWKAGTAADESNSVDLGPGSATYARSWSFLLPAKKFMFLPTNRVVAYAFAGGSDYESAGYHSSGRASGSLPSALNSGEVFFQVKIPDGAS